MNRFVDVLNRIRKNASLDWLTPSQRRAYHQLCERLKFLDEVNLWGHHGVGKTFLCWVLWKQGLAVYASRPQDVASSLLLRTVVVDNLGWRRREVRDVLRISRNIGYSKILLVTREPVEEQVSTVELVLNREDIEHVVANLRGVGVVPYSDAPRNLWDLVSPLDLGQ